MSNEVDERLRVEFGLRETTTLLLPFRDDRIIVKLPPLTEAQARAVLAAAAASGIDLQRADQPDYS